MRYAAMETWDMLVDHVAGLMCGVTPTYVHIRSRQLRRPQGQTSDRWTHGTTLGHIKGAN
ncbi:hypothetical protein M378DRAFT_164305 [Amanita muscaria Koide BX008]|uniref:Uncharacterized protein n=1 Tax=Amanita muscaria (strain Koide BX008) TaxID=946122 RepID=A0A0C2WPP3_AMAMK|nr:hypothetical protein M378DRAFT_164305 [Amanita muscaria Koide BX008]